MTVYQLDKMGEPANGPVQQEMSKLSGKMSVPQVYINGKFIGGGNELEELSASKKLKQTLSDAGASFGR